LAGEFRQQDEPIAYKKNAQYQDLQKIKSLFKHGLEWLKNVLVNSTIKKQEFFVLLHLLKSTFAKARVNCVVE